MDFCEWSSPACKGSLKHGVSAQGTLVSGWLWCCFWYPRVRYILKYGNEFQQDMNFAVEKIPTLIPPCSFCDKVCLSKGGLTRHISTKYQLETAETNAKVSKMLHPDIFLDII